MSLSRANYGPMPLTAVKGSRRTVSFRPVTEGQTYAPGGTARFHISGVDFIDPANFQLNFKLNVSCADAVAGSTDTGGICLPMSAESFIDYATVRIGGQVIDDVRNYGEVESYLHSVSQSTDSVYSLGAICTGQTFSDSDRIIPFTSSAGVLGDHIYQDAYFSIDLSGLALFGTNPNMVPIRYLAARQPVEIEIRWQQAKHALTLYPPSAGDAVVPTAVTYSISDTYITADSLDMDAVSMVWDERILSEPMVYPVETITHYSAQLARSTTRFQHVWSHPGEDLRTVVCMFTCNGIRDLATADNPLCISDMSFFPPNLSEASLQVGTRLFPETDRMKFVYKGTDTKSTNLASNGVMAFREAIKAAGRSGDHRSGFLLTPDLWSKNKFPVVITSADGFKSLAATGLVTAEDYRTTFALVFNLDSNPSENTPVVAGTGLSTLSATTHALTLNLFLSAARNAYVKGDTNDPTGGDYTVDMFCFTKENLIVYADRVERQINLILPPAA